LDAGGRIALPGLIEAHTHLDKNFVGLPWVRNETTSVRAERIVNERRIKRELRLDARLQAERQLALTLSHGTTHLRSHVDVDPEVGLESIEGVIAARETFRGRIDVEIVAFPQSGCLAWPGVAALMDEALRVGADVVGGIDPGTIDRDPVGHLDLVFGLAARHGKPVDIHLHEPDELGAFCLELMAERTKALGLQGRVMASHAYCLGALPEKRLGLLLDTMAQAGIAVMTAGPPGMSAPSVQRLRAAGVRVCVGTDAVRGFFVPYGSGDMIDRLARVAERNGMSRDDELEAAFGLITTDSAAALGVSDYGLHVGAKADLVLLQAETLAQALIEPPRDRIVIKDGAIVAGMPA
jgi:cytosine/adenosine deaminase-related metal-dependent hydrolase